MSAKPQRAYRLTLELEADTREDMVQALDNFAIEVHRDGITRGVTGGVSSSSIYELIVNPEITHEAYMQSLREYLAARKSARADNCLLSGAMEP